MFGASLRCPTCNQYTPDRCTCKKPSAINPDAFPPTNTLPKCSKQQFDSYMEQAKVFVKTTGYYQSIMWDATILITEYIAYQEGYTIRDFTKVST